MEEDRMAEVANMAHGFFLKMVGSIESRDIERMTICFYDLVKQTYGLAKGQNVYEKEKEKIDDTLKGMLVMIKMMLEREGWTEEMIEEFDVKVMEIWITD